MTAEWNPGGADLTVGGTASLFCLAFVAVDQPIDVAITIDGTTTNFSFGVMLGIFPPNELLFTDFGVTNFANVTNIQVEVTSANNFGADVAIDEVSVATN